MKTLGEVKSDFFWFRCYVREFPAWYASKKRRWEGGPSTYDEQRDYWFGFAGRMGEDWHEMSNEEQERRWLANYEARKKHYLRNQLHVRNPDKYLLEK